MPLFFPAMPVLIFVLLLFAVMGATRAGACSPRCRSIGRVILIIFGVALLAKTVSLVVPRAIQVTNGSVSVQRGPSVWAQRGPTPPRVIGGPSGSRAKLTVPRQPAMASAVSVISPTSQPSTQISSRAWIDDWSQFVNSTNWQGFRAESSDICTSEDEARQEAITSAARQLYQQAVSTSGAGGDFRWTIWRQSLEDQMATRLRSGEFIADQYVKKTDKVYGTLYKVYLLVDTSGPNSNAVVRAFQSTVQTTTSRQLTTWGSLGVLGLVIILLYAFLNAVTKGYFVWRLRAAAAMILIIALLTVMAIT